MRNGSGTLGDPWCTRRFTIQICSIQRSGDDKASKLQLNISTTRNLKACKSYGDLNTRATAVYRMPDTFMSDIYPTLTPLDLFAGHLLFIQNNEKTCWRLFVLMKRIH